MILPHFPNVRQIRSRFFPELTIVNVRRG